jgi:hypothetical protein
MHLFNSLLSLCFAIRAVATPVDPAAAPDTTDRAIRGRLFTVKSYQPYTVDGITGFTLVAHSGGFYLSNNSTIPSTNCPPRTSCGPGRETVFWTDGEGHAFLVSFLSQLIMFPSSLTITSAVSHSPCTL